MALQTVRFPSFDRVGDFEAELRQIVNVADSGRTVPSEWREFLITGNYTPTRGVQNLFLELSEEKQQPPEAKIV